MAQLKDLPAIKKKTVTPEAVEGAGVFVERMRVNILLV